MEEPLKGGLVWTGSQIGWSSRAWVREGWDPCQGRPEVTRDAGELQRDGWMACFLVGTVVVLPCPLRELSIRVFLLQHARPGPRVDQVVQVDVGA